MAVGTIAGNRDTKVQYTALSVVLKPDGSRVEAMEVVLSATSTDAVVYIQPGCRLEQASDEDRKSMPLIGGGAPSWGWWSAKLTCAKPEAATGPTR